MARIGRLLGDSTLPWRALHVAGTNGKGSVCAYASSMLHAAGVPCGRFTSPHLVEKRDCITVNERIVEESLFRQIEDRLQIKNEKEQIGASEFELLTATAFCIFAQEKLKIGVVEVGLGGRLDATNILKDPLVTVITKIGKDHEAFLGNTLEAIAYQKAGIMKPQVPCIVDSTNPESVLEVIARFGQKIGSGPVTRVPQHTGETERKLWEIVPPFRYEQHQQTNIILALEAVKLALTSTQLSVDLPQLMMAVQNTIWPGRLQLLKITSLTGRREDILVDGAHNVQSAIALRVYVDRRLRIDERPVTWVIGVSKGKDLQQMLGHLLKQGDNLTAVEFGPVDGMPWVEPTPSDDILREALAVNELHCSRSESGTVGEALQWASVTAAGGPLVVAGSLYLVSDVFRLLRNHK